MEYVKTALFGLIVVSVLLITGYLIWSTIAINIKSVTKGPVHYHGDFQIWNCGKLVDLIDPKGWDNKVGIPLLHEHNDGRIHVEGPVLDYKDITLGKFVEVVGGQFTNSALVVPVNGGTENLADGMVCNGEIGNLQVFVYKQSLPSDDGKTQGKAYHQEKLTNPSAYVLSPSSKVPPGDCIIIELDKPKDKTDKICAFYKIARDKGELKEE